MPITCRCNARALLASDSTPTSVNRTCVLSCTKLWNQLAAQSSALHLTLIHDCSCETSPLQWQVCKSCGEEKPACEFTRYRMRRDGLYNWCKQCDIWKRQERRKRKRDEAYTMTGGMMQASKHATLSFAHITHSTSSPTIPGSAAFGLL